MSSDSQYTAWTCLAIVQSALWVPSWIIRWAVVIFSLGTWSYTDSFVTIFILNGDEYLSAQMGRTR